MTKRIIFSLAISALILSSSLAISTAQAQSQETPLVDESEQNVGSTATEKSADKADHAQAKSHKKAAHKKAHKKNGEHKKGKKPHGKKHDKSGAGESGSESPKAN